jgi:histone deacetylase 1/2
MDNANTRDYLDKIRTQVIENLRRTAFAPSVQMTDVPREPLVEGMDDEADAILDDLDEDENKDKRFTKRRFDQYIEKVGELSDSEDEEENATNGVRHQPNAEKRRNRVNYRNLAVADSGVDSGMGTPRDISSLADDDIEMTVDDSVDKVTTTLPTERQSLAPTDVTSKAGEDVATDKMDTTADGSVEPPAMSSAASPATLMSAANTNGSDREQEVAAETIEATQEKTPPASPPQTAISIEAVPTIEPTDAPATAASSEAPEPADDLDKAGQDKAEEETTVASEAIKMEELPEAEETGVPEQDSTKIEE